MRSRSIPFFQRLWRRAARLFAGNDRSEKHAIESPIPPGPRLNLGCGAARLDGYVNIDSNPNTPADLHLDFRRIESAFAPGSVSGIVMLHSLAYLNLWQARDLFRRLHALLMPGGGLVVETPDVERCAEKLLGAGKTRSFNDDFLEGVRGLYAFGRDDMGMERDFTPYAFGWAGWHLKRELEAAGFAPVRILEPQTHMKWRDVRVEAVKPAFRPG